MKKIRISWPKYERLVEELARSIHRDFIPNQIVAVATGGLTVGLMLSKMFKAPLAILGAESYPVGKTGIEALEQKSGVIFSRDILKTKPGFGNLVLLVDDLTETGETLSRSENWLKQHYGDVITGLKTAVIWHKTRSIYQPHFFVEKIDCDPKDQNWPWIVQPVEKYEKWKF